MSTRGRWSPTEANLHINALELIAASFAVKAFHHRASYRPLRIKLLINNTTAVSYINRLGGTHSRLLSQIACNVWRWAVQHEIRLQAEYVPSEESPADHPFRGSLSESGDWRLDPALFRRIQRAAPWTLVLDLFASRLNTQLPAFYAWRPDPEALALDAFSQNWSLPHQDAVYAPSLSLSAIGAPGCDEAETQGRQSIPDHTTTPLIHGSHMTGLRGSSKKMPSHHSAYWTGCFIVWPHSILAG